MAFEVFDIVYLKLVPFLLEKVCFADDFKGSFVTWAVSSRNVYRNIIAKGIYYSGDCFMSSIKLVFY
jgi:hypothetical protein